MARGALAAVQLLEALLGLRIPSHRKIHGHNQNRAAGFYGVVDELLRYLETRSRVELIPGRVAQSFSDLIDGSCRDCGEYLQGYFATAPPLTLLPTPPLREKPSDSRRGK